MNEAQTTKLMGRKEHAARINEAWQRAVDGAIETGLRIIDAQDGLEHGEYIAMVESDLNFSRFMAFRFVAIASNKTLSNDAHVQHLPAAVGTLYDLTVIANKGYDLEAGIESGAIHPKMERKEVKALLPTPQRDDDLEEAEPDPEDEASDGASADDAGDSDERADTFIRRVLEFTSEYANGFRDWQKTANVSDKEREALADTLHQCANELSILAQEVQGFMATIEDKEAAETGDPLPADEEVPASTAQPQKRGRPKGSKNKTKPVEEPITAVVPPSNDAEAAAEERKALYAATETAGVNDQEPAVKDDFPPLPEFLRAANLK